LSPDPKVFKVVLILNIKRIQDCGGEGGWLWLETAVVKKMC